MNANDVLLSDPVFAVCDYMYHFDGDFFDKVFSDTEHHAVSIFCSNSDSGGMIYFKSNFHFKDGYKMFSDTRHFDVLGIKARVFLLSTIRALKNEILAEYSKWT